MADEYLDPDATGLVAGADRPLPSHLRDVPLFVEPLLVRHAGIDAPWDAAGVDRLRGELLERIGFAPRDIASEAVDIVTIPGRGRAAPAVALDVHGEQVWASGVTDVDDARRHVATAIERSLWRLLVTDDVTDLLAFARLESPTSIDRVVPHRLGLEHLVPATRELLRELVPIRPYARIVELFGQVMHDERHPLALVDHVRRARRRAIVQPWIDEAGALPVIEVAPEAASACSALVAGRPEVAHLRRRLVDRLVSDIAASCDGARHAVLLAPQGHRRSVAVLLEDTPVRRTVVGTIESEIPDLTRVTIATIGRGIHVPLEGPSPRDWLHGGPPLPMATPAEADIVDVHVQDAADWNW